MWHNPVKNLSIAIASALAVLIFAIIGLQFANRPTIPSAVSSKVNFVMFYPQPSKKIIIDTKTFKYDTSLKQFSFIVNFQGHAITFAEQPTPEQFSDIPQYFPTLLDKMRSYATFENAIGQVALTRPAEVKNQVAVMNSKGTLTFAQTNGDMSADQWRELFNNLKLSQPK
jgi:hypothetical protein